MSKLVDMLTRGKGEIADVIRPLVASEPAPPPLKADAQNTLEAAAPVKTSTLTAIRAVSLRLPAPSPLLPFEKGQRRASEQYRILRTKISQHPKQPHLIVVSSPAPGDGKSVSA